MVGSGGAGTVGAAAIDGDPVVINIGAGEVGDLVSDTDGENVGKVVGSDVMISSCPISTCTTMAHS
jgi:hypothetical protein